MKNKVTYKIATLIRVCTAGSGANHFGCEKSKYIVSVQMKAFTYQVHGKVQGVFFRKYTLAKANELHIRGFVENSTDGSHVFGEAEGPTPAINEFKHWLAETGSPKSKISSAKFQNERIISSFSYADFSIRK